MNRIRLMCLRRVFWGRCALVLPIMLIALSGCERHTVRTSVGLKAGERRVNATVDGSASISNEGDTVLIVLDDGTLTVEKERVVLDGKEQARLPATAKHVQITRMKGKLTVVADGTGVQVRDE